jgi:CRP/FNR family cyclic AMP-dependent transcriptional regulator
MSLAEFMGYLAALLVFTTFYMRTMVRLRIVGIASNVVFITYALLDGLVPILILHSALLPLNILRLVQLNRLVGEIRSAAVGDLSLDALLPFMTRRTAKVGQVLFKKGEVSREVFYLLRGRIRLEEFGITVAEGETVGEISLFSATGERTATAVCEVECELLSIGNDRVVQLFHQHPNFGFFLVRLITRRLIEDYERLEARFAGRPVPENAGPATPTGDRRAAERTARRLRRHRRLRRFGYAIVGLVLLIYTGVAITPYLQSVLIRDAIVTTWINTATAPIAGNLAAPPLPVGHEVEADGHVADVKNEHLDDSAVARAEAEAAQAGRLVAERERHLQHLRQLSAEWQERFSHYVQSFRENLQLAAERERRQLELLEERLQLARAELQRMAQLQKGGNVASSAAEQAEADVIDLQLQQAEHEKTLADLDVRLRGSTRGVYLAADGKEADWAYRGRDQLTLEIARAERELGAARATLEQARASVQAGREGLARQASAAVLAPPGSVIWSVPAGTDTALNAGDPIVQWIDCSVVLVDVPVSDLEAALLRDDMGARVMLDGEPEPRLGRILHIRGSASTLGRDDLAAVADRASGRGGQVIVELKPEPEHSKDCRIGRGAFVDFPDISVIDWLRAWLRI